MGRSSCRLAFPVCLYSGVIQSVLPSSSLQDLSLIRICLEVDGEVSCHMVMIDLYVSELSVISYALVLTIHTCTPTSQWIGPVTVDDFDSR